jgi:CRP/FNR family transcriptional regulator, cyclic AMP receptor protein
MNHVTINHVTIIGFIAAGLVIATLSMRTMIPLRVVGIASNVAFFTYGILFGSYPTVMLHTILLPINIYRLREMLNLIKQVEAASKGDMSLDWLKPFMSKRSTEAGEILFRKGDEANHLYFVVTGRLHLREIDIDILPGSVVGELGMLAPERKRTQTLECTDRGSVLEIGYDKIKELYYQNPKFGFYFLRLATARLFSDVARLERALVERDQEILNLRKTIAC